VADSTKPGLNGKAIFVSRAREESPELCRVLESEGAKLITEPLLRFAAPEDTTSIDVALQNLAEFDWWVLTSRHAVEFAALRGRVLKRSLKELAGQVRIGAIGSATSRAAQAAGLQVSYAAHEQSSAGLAAELALSLAGKRVLLLRSNLADSSLPQALAKSGSQVTDLIAYYTLGPDDATKARLESLDWGGVDSAIFFSPSAIQNLALAVGPERWKVLANSLLAVAIGATTAEALRQSGVPRCVQAQQPSLEEIIAALHAGLAISPSHKIMGAQRS